MDRRNFLKLSAGMGLTALLGTAGVSGCSGKSKLDPSVGLPPLPFALNELEPFISQKTLEFHYTKHHRSYVEKTTDLIAGTAYAGMPLVEVVKQSAADQEQKTLFNNAAQDYNHAFYWQGLSPTGGGKPHGEVKQVIDRRFGSHSKFLAEFKKAALTQFGSGWAWLVQDAAGELQILQTANADTPIAHDLRPLFTIDVWEHAYYLDYQNRRADYIDAVLEHLINWDHIARQLA